MSSVCCTGVTRPIPGAAKWGLYKSTNGGATWSFIHNGSADGATAPAASRVQQQEALLAPWRAAHRARSERPGIVYASSYARGIWRSNDAGATWAQINPSLNAA